MTTAGMGGFAKGFAAGFVPAFQAVQQRQHDTDQLTLKYRLEQLREDADARKKKQEEEQAAIENGKRFAESVNAPDFAPRASEMFRMGMTPAQILEQFPNYRKKPVADQQVEVPNPDSVSNKVNIPAGVISTEKQPLDPVSQDMSVTNSIDPNTAMAPAITNEAEMAKTRGLSVEQLQESERRANEAITKAGIKIESPEAKKAKYEQKMAQFNDGYEYIAPTKKENFPSLEEAYFKRTQAKNAGNMDEYYKMDSVVKAYSYAKGLEKVGDPTVHQFAQLDEKGKLIGYFDGLIEKDEETGQRKYYNLDAGKYMNGNIRYIPKDVYMNTGKVMAEFEQASVKYDQRLAKFTGALDGGAQMVDMIDQYNILNTKVGSWTAGAKNMLEEAQKGLQLVEKELNTAVDNQDYSKISENANTLRERINDMMSKGIKSEAEAVILFETLKTSLVYDLAAAKGETGNGLTQKDIQQFRDQLSAKDGPTLKRQIAFALTSTWRSIDSERTSLNTKVKSGSVKQQEMALGFSLGYEKPRYENHLREMYADKPEMLNKVLPLFKAIDQGSLPGPSSTAPEDVVQEQKPMEIEVQGRKVITGKVYKSKSGQLGTFNSNGEWVPQN